MIEETSGLTAVTLTSGDGIAPAAMSDEKAVAVKMYAPGATSFADLEMARALRQETSRLYELVDGFGMLAQNILSNEMLPDKPAAIGALVGELQTRIVGGELSKEATLALEEEEQGEAAPAVADDEVKEVAPAGGVLGGQSSGVLVWKERSGAMRWLGTHTNHYIDRDNPPDILSAGAHERFADRVAKGIDPAPELWIWHAPVPVGEADYLAWDDRGFLISSGTVYPAWEGAVKALTESGEVLGMSHGMPLESIVRDPADPRVILDYRSKEISILPLEKAANLLTTFATEETMEEKGLRSDQRQRLIAMMGEDNVKQLEGEIERKARNANAKGLESKEASAPAVEAKKEEAGAVAEEGKPPVAVDVVDVAERGEIAEAIAEAMELVTAAFGKSINELAVQVEALQKQVASQKVEMAEQVAEKAATTPRASVAALLSKRLGGSFGTPLDTNDPLMKGGPKESEKEDVKGFGGWL